MRLAQVARGRVCVLISFLALTLLIVGCGSSAVETPAEIPPAPQDASKASAQAFFGKKMAPKAAARK